MTLTIIVPVFNEENTVEILLNKVLEVRLSPYIQKQVIVVDDCSSDLSWKLIQRFARGKGNVVVRHHKKNQGKGAAIRTALSLAKGDIILIQDADLEYSPVQYPKLLKPFKKENVEVVYGTRLKSYPVSFFGPKRTPLISHFLGNKMLTFFTNLLYRSNLTDMETCYKVIRKEVFKDIRIESNKFEFEPEITAKILKKGIKIHEVQIKVIPRGYDEGKKISWKDGFSALRTLIKYRFS